MKNAGTPAHSAAGPGGWPWTQAAPQTGSAPRPRPAKISPRPARAKTSE